MKLLEVPTLVGLRSCMNGGIPGVTDSSPQRLTTYLSLFSTKTTSDDSTCYRKLAGDLKVSLERRRNRALSMTSIQDDIDGGRGAQSPLRNVLDIGEEPPYLDAPPQAPDSMDIKTLWHLISVLNASFPDFDFSCVCLLQWPGPISPLFIPFAL